VKNGGVAYEGFQKARLTFRAVSAVPNGNTLLARSAMVSVRAEIQSRYADGPEIAARET
jgi:hypothetical protein